MYVASDIIIEQGMEWIYTSRYLRWKNKKTTFHVNSVSFSDTWTGAGILSVDARNTAHAFLDMLVVLGKEFSVLRLKAPLFVVYFECSNRSLEINNDMSLI